MGMLHHVDEGLYCLSLTILEAVGQERHGQIGRRGYGQRGIARTPQVPVGPSKEERAKQEGAAGVWRSRSTGTVREESSVERMDRLVVYPRLSWKLRVLLPVNRPNKLDGILATVQSSIEQRADQSARMERQHGTAREGCEIYSSHVTLSGSVAAGDSSGDIDPQGQRPLECRESAPLPVLENMPKWRLEIEE